MTTPFVHMIKRPLVAAIMASTALTGTAMMMATSAAAVEAASSGQVNFDIPAQTLASALRQFGDQAKIQFFYSQAAVKDRSSNGIKGAYSVDDALSRLLGSADLTYEYSSANTVVIRAAKTQGDTGPAGNTAPPHPKNPAVTADGRENETAKNEFEEIIVNSKRIASTATKFNLNVVDTPQSIKAITRDIIDVASIREVQDLTKIDASTTTKGGENGTQELTFRGFDVDRNNGMLIDGVRTQTFFALDLGAFERIEILKGPSSSLYGTNAVGGMINSISKQPSATPGGTAAVYMGSFDFFRFEGDATGSLTDDKRLTVRAFGAYENGGDFVDYSRSKAKVAYGALRYELTEKTTVDFNAHYQTRIFPADGGIAPFFPTAETKKIEIPDVPASRLAGSPDTKRQGDFLSFRNDVTHVFDNEWKLKFTGQYSRSKIAGGSAVIYDFDGIPANGDIDNVFMGFEGSKDIVWGGDLSLFGNFELFGHKNSFFISADYRKATGDYYQAFGGSALEPGKVFNIFNPDYTVFRRPVETAKDFSGLGHGGIIIYKNLEIIGGTAQVMLHPTDRLSILASGRFDHQRQIDKFRYTPDAPVLVDGEPVLEFIDAPNVQTITSFTPQIGSTYTVAENVNVYATYGKSFVPQSGFTWDGRAFRPERGWQVEGGIKGGFWDNKVTMSLAVFHMIRGNILGADVTSPPGVFGTVEIGEHRSRGVEFEAFGELSPGWTFIASAAYLDVIFSKADNQLDLGSRVYNVPRFAFALYSSYEIQSGPLAGLGFSGGVSNKSDRVWGQASSLGRPVVDAGGYTTADLRAFYQMGNLLFDVKVNNIWNEKYYNTSDGSLFGRIFVGRPREVIAGMKYKF